MAKGQLATEARMRAKIVCAPLPAPLLGLDLL